MRVNTISVSERNFLFSIGGQLFDQAPNRAPRKAEVIMEKARDLFRAKATNDNEYYTVRVETDKVHDLIREILFAIPEFEELNLSQLEYEAGVKVHDESRGKYKFTSAYDKETSESWKTDFIDLDAFTRNVSCNLYTKVDEHDDCFGCKNEGSVEKCSNCTLNQNLENNLEYARKPKGVYTFSCKYDCYKNRYICCEECKDKDSCTQKCTSSSCDCGLTLHKI